MESLLLIVYVIIIIGNLTESLAIGWLLLSSAVLGGYCLITMCSKKEKLTYLGKWVLLFSVIGFIYSIMLISGFDVKSLF